MGDVGGRSDRQIATQGQFHDQDAFVDLAMNGYIRDVFDQEIPVVNDAKRVALCFEFSQIGITSDQCV